MKRTPKSKPCVLLVDIGNTSVTLGLGHGRRLLVVDRVPTPERRPAELARVLRRLLAGRQPERACIASVVPAATARYVRLARKWTGREPLQVSHKIRLGVPVTCPHPETVGADRLADACAVKFRHRLPAIVVDFGTALTFNVVLPDRGFCYGVIAPGLPMMLDYLAERTALLPRITMRRPARAAGRTTVEAMLSGAYYGYRGLVEGILSSLQQELRLKNPAVIATGGFAALVIEGLREFTSDPHLTLHGLLILSELNEGDAQ